MIVYGYKDDAEFELSVREGSDASQQLIDLAVQKSQMGHQLRTTESQDIDTQRCDHWLV